MEQFLTTQLLTSLQSADIPKFLGYGLIFFFLWREIRGLKTELTKLSDSISSSFANGEKRFEKLEKQSLTYEHRFLMLEHKFNELQSSQTKEVKI